nr:immunoglobulin heavy chain junction region [Macaca mulatta]MOV55491.1 immunoglobulin heavy chain junction region [Macaca mulatta]MOV56125.1 immunoglobulin heavy chain junction region [Macaca mulatta]MOV56495.1 immunoglobulin heavy chain junction region [Macaca mulatta]MOV57891.1 immunoglobulin heavy chain junction region [Macaca mulatta]
CARKEDDFDVW